MPSGENCSSVAICAGTRKPMPLWPTQANILSLTKYAFSPLIVRASTPLIARSNASRCSFPEEGVSAIDEEGIARVIAARVADEVDRDLAEVRRSSPAARGHAGQDLLP